jgi:hypothetical protein
MSTAICTPSVLKRKNFLSDIIRRFERCLYLTR